MRGSIKIGVELQHLLVRQTEDGGIEIAYLHTLEQPCYYIRRAHALVRLRRRRSGT